MVLQAKGISKTYKSKKFEGFTLNINSLEIEEGSFAAILGPNGSGKSTFIKLVLDLLFLDEGQIELFGIDHKNKEARQKVSYLPENFSFPKKMTVKQMLKAFDEITPESKESIENRISTLAEAFNVDYLNKKIKDLSKGMRQMTALMYTFLGDARFYILDEPFNGLDAVKKKTVMEYIFDLQQNENITVLITTHILSDIEKTCDTIHLIRNGSIIQSATKEEINTQFDSVEEYYLNHFDTIKPVQL